MREVEPTVRIIARSMPDDDAIATYLSGVGAGKFTNSRDFEKPEDLVEFAGRMCYRSWQPGLNKNVTKVRYDQEAYIRNILSSAHGCYDGETEVLTARGWIHWPDAREDDLFATRAISGELQYHRPRQLVSYHHAGKMYRVDARGVDLLVTPEHNMFVCPTTTKFGRLKEDYWFIPAQDLGTDSHAYIKSAEWTGGSEVISQDEARLLGFTIGDGTVHAGSAKILRFRLRRSRKIEWLRALCLRLGWPFHSMGGDSYSVTMPSGRAQVFREIYGPEYQKIIPQYLLTSCSKDVLQALFDGLIESDGHRSPTGICFDTTSDTLAGQFQQLCLSIGMAANVCYRRTDRTGSYGNLPLTRLSVITRELKPEVNKFSGAVGRSYWLDHWEGDVYCADVPNHTLYVRRNGKPVWSGNSVLEHVSWTFVLQDISRIVTHELVRHRAGVAISQESHAVRPARRHPDVVPELGAGES